MAPSDELTTREYFLREMSRRRQWAKGTAEHEAHTRAARKYLWIIRDVPPIQWGKL